MTPLLRRLCVCALLCSWPILGQDAYDNLNINVEAYANQNFDTLIYVGPGIPTTGAIPEISLYPNLIKDLNTFSSMDRSFSEHVSVHIPTTPNAHIKRVIFSPTGDLSSDTADSRSIYQAATKAASMAYIAAVSPTPLEGVANAPKPDILLVLGPRTGAPATAQWAQDGYAHLNAALGALYGLYVPRDVRKARPNRATKYAKLYLQLPPAKSQWVVQNTINIETGRWYTRDICGGDPETMNPQEMSNYIKTVVKYNSAQVTQTFIEDITVDEYPLVAAVDRASKNIERFKGKIVKLTYPANYDTSTAANSLYFVGSGVTMDNGGLDLKVANTMPGRHRDKCAAAAIVGFFKMLELMKPTDLKAKASLAILRNNLGSESFSTDEIIPGKSGKRIKIGFTDAESRIFLADLLYEQIEESTKDTASKQFYAVASFTDHVVRMYKYIMGGIENGVSRRAGELEKLQQASDLLSDPLEMTAVRWEDYDTNRGPLETEDYRNSSPEPLVGIQRGSQIAAAFLVQASRMEEHGLNTPTPLKFIYLDVTGSAGNGDTVPTASPLTTLAARYLIKTA